MNNMKHQILCDRDEWYDSHNAIGHLLGTYYGEGAIQNLIDANEALEDAEEVCDNRYDYDVDGVVNFTFNKHQDKLVALEDDFNILDIFARNAIGSVEEYVDMPFYKEIGKFIDIVEGLSIIDYKSENYLGIPAGENNGSNYGTSQTANVTIMDLFNEDNEYRAAAIEKYQDWLKTGREGTYHDFMRLNVYDSEFFTYQSFTDDVVDLILTLSRIIIPVIGHKYKIFIISPAFMKSLSIQKLSMVLGISYDDAEILFDRISSKVEDPQNLIDEIKELFN